MLALPSCPLQKMHLFCKKHENASAHYSIPPENMVHCFSSLRFAEVKMVHSQQLSLKNIYRLIRNRDYPIFSDGVISPANEKGLTLLSFWKQVLCNRWLKTPHGRIIWRSEGSINRYHSELCNRKAVFPFYAAYAEEILQELTDEEFYHQSQLFARFLQERDYRHPVFLQKMTVFLDMLSDSDRRVIQSPAFSLILTDHYVHDIPPAFLDGYLLTWLTLYAISDGRLDASAFPENALFFSPTKLYFHFSQIHTSSTEVLTDRTSEVWQSPLISGGFFGREKELFDLEEAARVGNKVLISGLGGIGKTELMRQLLIRCLQRETFHQVAAVQYHSDLSRSFAKSFLHLTGATTIECFYESLYLLSQDPNTLLLIDNVESADDPLLSELLSLPGAVILSGRFSALEGFTTLPLHSPSVQAASLIFRSHYLQSIQGEDREIFETLMDLEPFHHPLTVTLLSKAARANHWSIRDIAEKAQGTYTDIYRMSVGDSHKTVLPLQTLYHSASMDRNKRSLLRLFSVLPYGRYHPEQLLSLTETDPSSITENLMWFSNRGWLDAAAGTSFAMHPLIAECIRITPPEATEFTHLWQYAKETLQYDICNYPPEDPQEEKKALSEIVLHVADLLQCPLPREVGEICILAALWHTDDPVIAKKLHAIIEKVNGNITDLLLQADSFLFSISNNPEIQSRMYAELEHPVLSTAWRYRFFMQFLKYAYDAQIYDTVFTPEIIEKLTLFQQQELLQVRVSYDQSSIDYDVVQKGRALAQVLDAGRKKQTLTLEWDELLASLLAIHEEWEALEDLQREIILLRETTPESLPQKMQTEITQAHIAEGKGNLQEAIRIWKNLHAQFARYCGKSSLLYCSCCSQMGLMHAKAGYTDEALRFYEEGISLCQKKPGFASTYQVLLNNLGALLLDLGRPEEAFPYLHESESMALTIGGRALAEPRKNLARYYLLQGKREEARKLYEQILPVFAQQYGEEHSKTQQLRKTLQELDH